MLGGVKEANYFIAFEIILMQRAMIQASYIMLTRVVLVNTFNSSTWYLKYRPAPIMPA